MTTNIDSRSRVTPCETRIKPRENLRKSFKKVIEKTRMNENKNTSKKRKVIFVELQKLNVNEDLILKLIDQGKFGYLSKRFYFFRKGFSETINPL